MELDRLGVELRRRNGFESLDLGLAMLHAWRKPVFRAWLATYGPFAALVSVILWDHPSIAYLVVWWSKPAFDRVLLHVYGAAMFGAPPSVRDTLRALPRLFLRTGLLRSLTIARLSMARSLFLPVTQLEGQRGAAARTRRRVLGARGYGYAAWLSFFCANLVGIWTLGAVLVLLALLPVEAMPSLDLRDLLTYDDQWVPLGHARNLVVFVVETMIEPYFVAAGFSLYLNRRSQLEGWDLEVAFRRMALRRASSPTPVAASVAAALFACITLAAVPAPARATEAAPAQAAVAPATIRGTDALPFAPGAIKREVARILADPIFGRKETATRWVPRVDSQPARGSDGFSAWRRRIARAMELVASAGRVVVWIVAAAALGVAAYQIIKHRERWLRPRPDRAVPQMLFGLDVRPESLPADVVAAARVALQAGDAVGALGLLYRGALSALVNFAAVDFRAGDTERACWQRASPALSGDGARYFRRLLDAWLRAAYAHRPPDGVELAALCEDWSRHFRREAFAAGSGA